MKIKVVLCNCDGLKVEREDLDMNQLPYKIEQDIDVQYCIMHPQLCGSGGIVLLNDLLRGSSPDTCFIVGGCAPADQPLLLTQAIGETDFPKDQMAFVNVRGMNNQQARNAILEAVGQLLVRNREGTMVDAFGG